MDIRHQGNIHLFFNSGDGLGGALIGHRKAHDLTARGLKALNLGYGGLHIPGLGIAHGLNRDGAAAADFQSAHVDFFRHFSFHYPVTILMISLSITKAISASSSTMPAAWI